MGNGKRKKGLWKAGTATLLSAILALSALISRLPAGMEAYAAQADENGFVIEDGVLTRYTGTAAEVVIPEGVTSIGGYAFRGCDGLTSISIPSSVTSIGNYAFSGCVDLTSISIPSSVTSIGDSAFYCCIFLTDITIPEGVTSIGFWAFYGCSKLTNVSIPSSMTSIGHRAFERCGSLTSITIPEGVTSIGFGAFHDCSGLMSMVVEEGNTVYDSRENCNAIIETDSNTLIAGCSKTIIPGSVTSIDDAFYGCSSLTSISIPEGVTSIENYAFEGCSGLTSIEIPSSVTSIGDYAFERCDKLTIYGEEGSYAQTYAKENNIPFGLITKDYVSLPNQNFAEDEFAFRVDYNYEDLLPGKAKITIPAGNKWAGQRLYYYEILDDGTYSYVCRSIVAEDGSYTVKQSHCSSYVATTKVPENLGDCDGEDGITSKDALAILKYCLVISQEGFIAELADCDGEDGITSEDALEILKYKVEIISELK